MRQILGAVLILVAMVTYFKRSSTPEDLQSESTPIAEPFEEALPTGKESPSSTEMRLHEPPDVPSNPVFSEAEIPRSRASFQSLLSKVQNTLPTSRSLQQLPAVERHHTPLLLREAGRSLGQIAEALEENPQYANEAIVFYKACFKRSELPKSIRALCLANHRDFRSRIDGRSADEWTLDESAVPAEVLRLALSLSPAKE